MVFTVPSGKAFVSQNKGSCIKWHLKALHSLLHWALLPALPSLAAGALHESQNALRHRLLLYLVSSETYFQNFSCFLTCLNPTKSLVQLSRDCTAYCGHCHFHGNTVRL